LTSVVIQKGKKEKSWKTGRVLSTINKKGRGLKPNVKFPGISTEIKELAFNIIGLWNFIFKFVPMY